MIGAAASRACKQQHACASTSLSLATAAALLPLSRRPARAAATATAIATVTTAPAASTPSPSTACSASARLATLCSTSRPLVSASFSSVSPLFAAAATAPHCAEPTSAFTANPTSSPFAGLGLPSRSLSDLADAARHTGVRPSSMMATPLGVRSLAPCASYQLWGDDDH